MAARPLNPVASDVETKRDLARAAGDAIDAWGIGEVQMEATRRRRATDRVGQGTVLRLQVVERLAPPRGQVDVEHDAVRRAAGRDCDSGGWIAERPPRDVGRVGGGAMEAPGLERALVATDGKHWGAPPKVLVSQVANVGCLAMAVP